jgi:hypothetical protein
MNPANKAFAMMHFVKEIFVWNISLLMKSQEQWMSEKLINLAAKL